MIRIVFEAHGTTYDNEQHISSGHYDAPLSPLGERQAKELGERYKHDRFAAVFCSDLQRSYGTAEIASAERGVLVIKDPRLRECDYGDWTRRPSDEVEAERTNRLARPFPNGESYEEALERVRSFLQDLLKNHDGKNVMIVGHRATQHGLEHWINGVPLKEAVTAPWKWQPGWTYSFRRIQAATAPKTVR